MTREEFFQKQSAGALWDVGVSINRTNALPLDANEVFESYEKALAYAKGVLAYPGQLIAVVGETAVEAYIISVAGGEGATLQKLAATTASGDMGEDLAALTAEVGKIKTDVSNLTTKVADYDTVKQQVETNKTAIEAVEQKIGNIEGDKTVAQLITDTETSLKKYVGEEIGKQQHFSAKVVTSKEEMTDATVLYLFKPEGAEGKDIYEQYIVIGGVATLIGETSVDLSGYATSESVEAAINAAKAELNAKIVANDNSIKALGEKDTALEGRIKALEDVHAEANYVKSVSNEFAVSEGGELTLTSVDKSKVTGLADVLNGKVDKVDGSRLITKDEATKLEKLVLGEDGTVSISGEISASNVKELDTWITGKRDELAGLLSTANEQKLNGIEAGAQVNKLEGIKFNGTTVEIDSGKIANINFTPEAQVVTSEKENQVKIEVDKSMTVNSLNVNKLTQSEGDELILNGGKA